MYFQNILCLQRRIFTKIISSSTENGSSVNLISGTTLGLQTDLYTNTATFGRGAPSTSTLTFDNLRINSVPNKANTVESPTWTVDGKFKFKNAYLPGCEDKVHWQKLDGNKWYLVCGDGENSEKKCAKEGEVCGQYYQWVTDTNAIADGYCRCDCKGACGCNPSNENTFSWEYNKNTDRCQCTKPYCCANTVPDYKDLENNSLPKEYSIDAVIKATDEQINNWLQHDCYHNPTSAMSLGDIENWVHQNYITNCGNKSRELFAAEYPYEGGWQYEAPNKDTRYSCKQYMGLSVGELTSDCKKYDCRIPGQTSSEVDVCPVKVKISYYQYNTAGSAYDYEVRCDEWAPGLWTKYSTSYSSGYSSGTSSGN